jgi:hypothetical protein
MQRNRKGSDRILGLLILCGIGLLAPQWAWSQAISPQIGLDFNFNHTDVMMGGSVGICFNERINASVKLTFKGRLGSKRVLIETDVPNVLVQYRQRQYLLGIEADKRFKLTEFSETERLGAFLGGFGGLSFADYRGTNAKAPLGLGGAAEAGVYFSNTEAFILKIGYMYLPLQTPSVFQHRLFFSFDVIIGS